MPPKKTSTVLARPVGRYRPGIAPAAPVNSDSEDDEATAEDQMQEDELEQGQEDEEKLKLEEPGRGIKIGLRDVVVDQQGAVRVGGLDEVGRTEREKQDELAEDGTSLQLLDSTDWSYRGERGGGGRGGGEACDGRAASPDAARFRRREFPI